MAIATIQALHALGPEYLLSSKEQLWSFANLDLPISAYGLRTVIQASKQFVTEDVHFDNVRIAEILLKQLASAPQETMFSVHKEALHIVEEISTHSALWMSLRPNLLESLWAFIQPIIQHQGVTPVITLFIKGVALGRYYKIEKFDGAIEPIRGTRIVDLTALVSANRNNEAWMAIKCGVMPTIIEAASQDDELPKMEALQCILAFLLCDAELPQSFLFSPQLLPLFGEILFSPSMQQIRDEASLQDEKLRTWLFERIRSTAVIVSFSPNNAPICTLLTVVDYA